MGYDATFARLPVGAAFDLKGPERDLREWIGPGVLPDFPAAANRMSVAAGVQLGHVGPRHWLVQAEIAREAALVSALRPGEAPPEISIVHVSDTLGTLRITGPDAAHVAAIGCPLDLHPGVFPDDAISFTEFFGQKALVSRCGSGFDIAVERSFAPMMEDYLARALR